MASLGLSGEYPLLPLLAAKYSGVSVTGEHVLVRHLDKFHDVEAGARVSRGKDE